MEIFRVFKIVRTYFPYNRVTQGNNTTWGEHRFYSLEEFISSNDIFQKYRNLNEFPLKITLFRRYPTALNETELPKSFRSSYLAKEVWRSGGYSGVDGLMLANVAKSLNFTAVNVPQKSVDFGYKDWDGNFVGNDFLADNFKIKNKFIQ